IFLEKITESKISLNEYITTYTAQLEIYTRAWSELKTDQDYIITNKKDKEKLSKIFQSYLHHIKKSSKTTDFILKKKQISYNINKNLNKSKILFDICFNYNVLNVNQILKERYKKYLIKNNATIIIK